jgi:hypothetical protein
MAIVVALAAATFHHACCYGQGKTSPTTQGLTTGGSAVNPKRVSFYEVPLVCPAAPHIGCGSASKPLLMELENNPAVSEAWLNRAGTILAVVWSGPSTARQRAATLKAILTERQLTAKELKGKVRDQALKEFISTNGWYRGADVDRLSEEEAGVIAARWVGRIREKISVPEVKVQALQEGFTRALRRKLTGQSTRSETQQEMLRICREQLDEKDVAVLMEAFKAELEASSGEK